MAHYSFDLAQDIRVQSTTHSADAPYILIGIAAVSRRLLFLRDVLPGRHLAWPHFGICCVRGVAGRGVGRDKLWQLGLAHALGSKGYKIFSKNPIYLCFARGLTFSWFAFTLFWFWANWMQIGRIFAALSLPQWLGVWLAVWLCATAVLALWECRAPPRRRSPVRPPCTERPTSGRVSKRSRRRATRVARRPARPNRTRCRSGDSARCPRRAGARHDSDGARVVRERPV